MDKILDAAGNLLALAGIIVCSITVLARLMGTFFLAGFELKVWFLVGIGILVTALLAKVQVLLIRQRAH
ncbi:MAG: hypothetical protein EA417_18810 [Gammaproteobacteria bacterium]|nr:MAG: hypothetical protein EA417_18810 [Gammaproteobacteria bacterium]